MENYRVITVCRIVCVEGDDLLKIYFSLFYSSLNKTNRIPPLVIRKSSATYHNAVRHSGINIVGIIVDIKYEKKHTTRKIMLFHDCASVGYVQVFYAWFTLLCFFVTFIVVVVNCDCY